MKMNGKSEVWKPTSNKAARCQPIKEEGREDGKLRGLYYTTPLLDEEVFK